MSCFSLPSYLIRSVESAIRRFWWFNGESRSLAWLSWEQMCKAKSDGGLGFTDLRSFNLALLAKQGWRILLNPDSLLGKIFKARYFPNSSFMEAAHRTRPSATWRSIMKARPYLQQGLRKRIENGLQTDIWRDAWIPESGNFKIITHHQIIHCFPREWRISSTRPWKHGTRA